MPSFEDALSGPWVQGARILVDRLREGLMESARRAAAEHRQGDLDYQAANAAGLGRAEFMMSPQMLAGARRKAMDVALAFGPGTIRFIGMGPRGPIWSADTMADAAEVLRQHRTGEVRGLLRNREIGEISLPYGVPGRGLSDGAGFSKLDAHHPEVVERLPEIIEPLPVVSATPNRFQLADELHRAGVRRDYEGDPLQWLLTAFRRKDAPE
jgi:hypothetical protein